MLGGGFFVKLIDSKNAEPFGISEGAKAPLEKETSRTVGFYRVCALPQPLVPSNPGVWQRDLVQYSARPGLPMGECDCPGWYGFKDVPLLTQCCRLSTCQVQTTQIWFHSYFLHFSF